MSSKHFVRPSSSYVGEAGLVNRTKYQTDSTSTPKVPISSAKVDGDLNYLIDGMNNIYDSITSGSVLDSSITTVKIADAAVTLAKMANFAALSVMGVAGSSAATPAAITAASDGLVMVRDGTAIGFGQVATAGVGDAQITLAKFQNVNTQRLLGRATTGSGQVEQLTLDGSLTLNASTGVLSGTQATPAQIGSAALAVQADVNTGTSTILAVTPKAVSDALTSLSTLLCSLPPI